jgi:peptidoglycan/LPS O-acetylase OafA/YrhL
MLQIAFWLTSKLRLPYTSAANILLVDGIALALCIASADLSYRYFEKPFMKLKERFAVIQSRPA